MAPPTRRGAERRRLPMTAEHGDRQKHGSAQDRPAQHPFAVDQILEAVREMHRMQSDKQGETQPHSIEDALDKHAGEGDGEWQLRADAEKISPQNLARFERKKLVAEKADENGAHHLPKANAKNRP